MIKNFKLGYKNENTKIFQSKKNISLYIGDLSQLIDEENILNAFSKMSGLLSVRICRDVISKKSLCYGYINFKNKDCAKRAIKKMNFFSDKKIFVKPLRIMWKETDKTLRISSKGNIFINYLPIDFKTKDLYKLCTSFGEILSCKISFDESGRSKKFGFVHFFSSNDAKEAVVKLNGVNIQGKVLYTSPFIKKETRDLRPPKKLNYTNVYIKNLSIEKFNEIDIKNMFEVFGEITSIMIPKENHKPKGFAFVNFASHLDAEDAIFKMNKKKVGDSILYVSKAETMLERKLILHTAQNFRKGIKKTIQIGTPLIVLGIKKKIFLNLTIYLLLALGIYCNFKIVQLPEYDFSFFIKISSKKKLFTTLMKKKYYVILTKFFLKFSNFLLKKYQNIVPGLTKNEQLFPESGKFETKFWKNMKCFKFKNSEILKMLINRIKMRYSKKDLKYEWRKIIYFWFKSKKKNILPELIFFLQFLFIKSIEKLTLFENKVNFETEVSIRIY